MSLWHRAPRAVYSVYDEDDYLSASDAQDGEHDGTGSAAHVHQPRDVFTASPHRGRQARVLALTVLCVVAASAAGLVAFEVSHRSGSAATPTHHAPVRAPRSVLSGSIAPISKTSASSMSTSHVFVSSSPDGRAVATPAGHARMARLDTVPARRVGTPLLRVGRAAPLADVAERAGNESPPPAADPQADSEFGFER